jgi:transcriptional regulator with XRE-family HTH domain
MGNNNIAEKLSQLRNERNETQEHVAESIGVSSVSLSRYETGARMPKMDILAKIALHYGVTVDEILGINNEETKKPAEERLEISLLDRISKLSPENRVRVEAYLEGLLASQEN